MDIEKTLEYLENVMSSEVRIITLEKEISKMQAVLDYKYNCIEYLKTGAFDKIWVPMWLYGPEFEFTEGVDMDKWSFGHGLIAPVPTNKKSKFYIEHGWKYLLAGSDTNYVTFRHASQREQECYNNFSDLVRNDPFFDKIIDIDNKVVAAINELVDNNKLPRITCLSCSGEYSFHTFRTAVDCIYLCVIHDCEEFIDYQKYYVAPGFFDVLSKNQFYFRSIPKRVSPITPEEFKDFVNEYYSHPRFKTEKREIKKGLFSNKLVIEETDRYSVQDKELLATTIYPYYCELLKAFNSFIIECYNCIIENWSKDTVNKNIAGSKLPELKNSLQEEKETLEKLYGLNVIYPKYRSIIPLGSFIDYFASGRCNSFDGADGAYNLYENELRLDKISDKLDTIIEKLDEIKRNQTAMYYAISEVNGNIRELNSSIEKASQKVISTIISEGDATRRNISNNIASVAAELNNISSNTAVISANQEYTNKLLKISNERQNSIIKNQQFEQMLYTDPSIFGGRAITPKAYGKYH